MKHVLASGSIVAVLIATSAFAQAGGLSRTDRSFAKEAADGNLAEIELVKLGQQQKGSEL